MREIETWLMADVDNFAKYFSVSKSHLRFNFESIDNPKEFLVNICLKSRKKSIKNGVVPSFKSSRIVGAEYNPILLDFIKNHWDFEKAKYNSQSLNKTIKAIKKFVIN